MNNIKIKSICNLLFKISWLIYLIKSINVELKIVENLKIALTIIEFILLFACIILQKHNSKSLTTIFITEILLVLSFMKSKNYNMLLLFNSIIAVRNLDIKKIIKFDIKSKIILLSINFILILLNIIPNLVFNKGEIIRYGLGFYNPNTFAAFIFSLTLEIIYLNSHKSTYKHIIFSILVALLIIYISYSRGSFISLIVFITLLIINKKRINFQKIIPYLPIIFTIISLALATLYNNGNPYAVKINEILSNRLLCATSYLKDYSINLLGNNIVFYDYWIGYTQSIDIFYISALLVHGIIIYSLVLFLVFKLIKINIKQNNILLVNILITMCIYGLAENTAYTLSCNIFLLYISTFIQTKERGSNNEPINNNTNLQLSQVS